LPSAVVTGGNSGIGLADFEEVPGADAVFLASAIRHGSRAGRNRTLGTPVNVAASVDGR
jgi:hypothetical protein